MKRHRWKDQWAPGNKGAGLEPLLRGMASDSLQLSWTRDGPPTPEPHSRQEEAPP